MPVLKIEAQFEGPADTLFRAMTELTKTFGLRWFQDLKPISPLNIQVTSDGTDAGLPAADQNPVLNVSVKEIGLSTRVQNILLRKDLQTLGEVVNLSAEELRSLPHFGAGSRRELQEALEARGLKLPS